MTFADIPAVHAIERESFAVPWPDDAYRNELATNRLAAIRDALDARPIDADSIPDASPSDSGYRG
jgi:hypothetical protein